ncbi:hypothetical protein [Paraburkholderia youngii]|uniref:hypothetical protein n=1 Tax=Paraburkholderia youngii TaxID=2782701 RepID=UPI003D1A3058
MEKDPRKMTKKAILLLALASAFGVSHAAENCTTKNVRLPIVDVEDLHLDYDLPEYATSCTDGKCESHVLKIDHFVTNEHFRVVLAYKGDSISYETDEPPEGDTVVAQVYECGKKHTPRSVKPAA